ncbi:hypothetical protein EKH55_0844 [Sinorhizobium alkalisoli]|nr:hypothetical protein EKH55_0844 [Sinorhizobium alkalisoli]
MSGYPVHKICTAVHRAWRLSFVSILNAVYHAPHRVENSLARRVPAAFFARREV